MNGAEKMLYDPFALLDSVAKQAPVDTELERKLLWAFYDAWEALHAIPNEPKNRRKSEIAAEMLVEAAHALRTIRAPQAIAKVING